MPHSAGPFVPNFAFNFQFETYQPMWILVANIPTGKRMGKDRLDETLLVFGSNVHQVATPLLTNTTGFEPVRMMTYNTIGVNIKG